MQFTDLPNELVFHIYESCADIPSVLNLATTCHHFRRVLSPIRRLPTLYVAAEAQFGPVSSAVTLVTHNTSQSAHLPRPSPPHSLALLTRLLAVGRVANQWANCYPFQKWRGPQSSSRRLLTPLERHRLRRACYRLWLYSLAFHKPQRRTMRLSPPIIRSRAALLRSWPTDQLAEMLDLSNIFRDVVQTYICPSNALVLRRHKARLTDDTYPTRLQASHHYPPGFPHAHFHSTPHVSKLLARSRPDGYGYPSEGWGDEIAHYYVVEDMLKLDPGQLMDLFSELTGSTGASDARVDAAYVGHGGYAAGAKMVVERFVADLGGEWFENNGETFVETVGLVVGDRGMEMRVLREKVEGEMEGIARM